MEPSTTPTCIGLILDGNRRWANERGLPQLEGHRQGKDTLEKIVLAVRDRGIEHVVAYAFSTENWGRSDEEVAYLMDLFFEALGDLMTRLAEEGVAVRYVGQREKFSPELRQRMDDTEKNSPHHPKTTLWLCLSYGGRADIVHAAEALRNSGEPITDVSFAEHLWTNGMPTPDLIVRTGGEQRLSNFLLWEAAYSELFFVPTYWPDFTENDLDDVLHAYAARTRRLGK